MKAKSVLVGRPMEPANVRRVIGKIYNRAAFQLSEAILAKALQGDSTSQQAAVEMLKLGLSQDAK